MLKVVAIMAVGIFIGFLLRNKTRVVKLNDRLTLWAIYLLLFLLGLSTGANKAVIGNLHNLGVESLIIAAGGVLGSVVMATLVYRFWFKSKVGKHHEE